MIYNLTRLIYPPDFYQAIPLLLSLDVTFTILVANSGLSGENDPARRNSVENGIGESPRSRPTAPEQGNNSKIRVIRRSSRWKNKPRQANKEDNEILEDSGEEERAQASEAGGPSKLLCLKQTFGGK